MNRSQRRAHAKRMRSTLPANLEPLPKSRWPVTHADEKRREVWHSRDYLVQVFIEPNGYRISVNRTEVSPGGRWDDNLSWDELQEIKRKIGFGIYQAIEIYPPDDDVINVANMRHLWVMDEPLQVGW